MRHPRRSLVPHSRNSVVYRVRHRRGTWSRHLGVCSGEFGILRPGTDGELSRFPWKKLGQNYGYRGRVSLSHFPMKRYSER
jgi:hypothetical protein